jgi:predicted GNAT family acetyltransferase
MNEHQRPPHQLPPAAGQASSSGADAARISDNAGDSRFESLADRQRAELVYRRRGDRLVLLHTEVPEPLGGRGLGGALVRAAVERARRDGLTVVPLCPFAADWLTRHPEAAAGVEIDWPRG